MKGVPPHGGCHEYNIFQCWSRYGIENRSGVRRGIQPETSSHFADADRNVCIADFAGLGRISCVGNRPSVRTMGRSGAIRVRAKTALSLPHRRLPQACRYHCVLCARQLDRRIRYQKLPGSCAPFPGLIRCAGKTYGSCVYDNRDRRADRRPWVVAHLLWPDPSASWCDRAVTDRLSLQHVIGLSIGGERRRTIWGECVSSSDFLGGVRVPFGWFGSRFGNETTIAQVPVPIIMPTLSES